MAGRVSERYFSAAPGVKLKGVPDSELRADFVADASGRGSRMPQWLREAGLKPPAQERIIGGVAYASRLYSVPDGWFENKVCAFLPCQSIAGAVNRHMHVSFSFGTWAG
jgi:hypothetical protein